MHKRMKLRNNKTTLMLKPLQERHILLTLNSKWPYDEDLNIPNYNSSSEIIAIG